MPFVPLACEILGHGVDSRGVSLESGKVEAIEKWPTP